MFVCQWAQPLGYARYAPLPITPRDWGRGRHQLTARQTESSDPPYSPSSPRPQKGGCLGELVRCNCHQSSKASIIFSPLYLPTLFLPRIPEKGAVHKNLSDRIVFKLYQDDSIIWAMIFFYLRILSGPLNGRLLGDLVWEKLLTQIFSPGNCSKIPSSFKILEKEAVWKANRTLWALTHAILSQKTLQNWRALLLGFLSNIALCQPSVSSLDQVVPCVSALYSSTGWLCTFFSSLLVSSSFPTYPSDSLLRFGSPMSPDPFYDGYNRLPAIWPHIVPFIKLFSWHQCTLPYASTCQILLQMENSIFFGASINFW